jgi:hypothetical protein
MRSEALPGKLAIITTSKGTQSHRVPRMHTEQQRVAITEQTSPVAVRPTAWHMTSLNRKAR